MCSSSFVVRDGKPRWHSHLVPCGHNFSLKNQGHKLLFRGECLSSEEDMVFPAPGGLCHGDPTKDSFQPYHTPSPSLQQTLLIPFVWSASSQRPSSRAAPLKPGGLSLYLVPLKHGSFTDYQTNGSEQLFKGCLDCLQIGKRPTKYGVCFFPVWWECKVLQFVSHFQKAVLTCARQQSPTKSYRV